MAIDSQPSEPFLARNGAVVIAAGGRVDVLIDALSSPGTVSSILLHDGHEAQPVARLMTVERTPIRTTALPPAAPLPSNGLPDHLDLKNAARVELLLAGSENGWTRPPAFVPSAPPAFRVKAGRTVVLALANRLDAPQVFHLHGHHFRLLDRLDDGWKPFWLDTLAVEPGKTERVAFSAEYAGHWLLETVAIDGAPRRLLRWYSVE
jgi:FtsP/CotA-like multicopper oxidase with cupredoxin domain